MHILFYVSLLIIVGLVLSKLVEQIRLPHVTGYLIAGLLIGPYGLSWVLPETLNTLTVVTESALGFIAFGIGSALNVKRIKSIENSVTLIALFESLFAVVTVTLAVFFLFGQTFAFSIVLGSIAAATAPAATMMVIRQFQAKGRLVDTLMPVVAIDNAIGIILFSLVLSWVLPFLEAQPSVPILISVFSPLLEIGLALFIGAAIGLLLSYLFDKIENRDQLLCIIIAALGMGIGLAHLLDLSSMLLCLSIGAVVTNISRYTEKTFTIIDGFTPPFYILFFVLAGLKLDLTVFGQVGLIGAGYILLRAVGKLVGANIGTRLVGCIRELRMYLGPTLIPQAGVALGLSILAESKIPMFGADIRAIIIASTIIYEMVGPVIAKTALIKAGQITHRQ